MLQEVIGLRKMAAAEEATPGHRRRVGRFQDEVFAFVNQAFFAPGEVSPEHENQVLPALGELVDDRIGEILPADFLVGLRFIAFHGEHGVEQEYALFGPAGKVAMAGDGDAGIVAQLFVDILQGGGNANALGHRKG